MTKPIIYISGKITGNPDYKADFEKAEKMLREKGFNAINPCKIGEYDFFTYEQFLHIDFALIDIADAILMLPNWESSKGANRELQYARSRGKCVILKDDLI